MNTFRLKRNLDEAVYEQILSSIFEGKFHSGAGADRTSLRTV